MKRAIILHGTNAKAADNWFPWLVVRLRKRGWKVWVPNLPQASKPNVHRYAEFLFGNKKWVLDKNTVLIGHSSGAVAILGLLQHLPEEVVIDTAVLVGAFKDNLDREDLKELFEEPLNFARIKRQAKRFVLIHSDNDPYCPLDHARFLAKKLGGELVVIPGQGHFSLSDGPQHRKIPAVLEVFGLV